MKAKKLRGVRLPKWLDDFLLVKSQEFNINVSVLLRLIICSNIKVSASRISFSKDCSDFVRSALRSGLFGE